MQNLTPSNALESPPATTALKQVRLLIGTQSTDELYQFYLIIVQPYQANLVSAVEVFEKQLLPLFAWLSHSAGREHWRWVNFLPPTPDLQVRYSRNDELLAKLQDQAFRSAFEKALRLWREYKGIFTTVLAHPSIAKVAAETAQDWFKTHTTDTTQIVRHSRGLLWLLRDQQQLSSWGRGMV